MKELYDICWKIYEEGQWPKDVVESIIIPIEKKVGAEECSDYRTLSLISHPSKIDTNRHRKDWKQSKEDISGRKPNRFIIIS